MSPLDRRQFLGRSAAVLPVYIAGINAFIDARGRMRERLNAVARENAKRDAERKSEEQRAKRREAERKALRS